MSWTGDGGDRICVGNWQTSRWSFLADWVGKLIPQSQGCLKLSVGLTGDVAALAATLSNREEAAVVVVVMESLLGDAGDLLMRIREMLGGVST